MVLGQTLCPLHVSSLDPGILEHLEVELPLGVIALIAEFAPKANQPITSFIFTVSLINFCFHDLSIGANGVLKSPNIII